MQPKAVLGPAIRYPGAVILWIVLIVIAGKSLDPGRSFESEMWMVTFFGFIVCLIAAYLFGFWREQPATKDGFAIANYDVPHCDFTKTAEGFIVSFNQAKLGVHKGMADLSQPKGVGQAVGSLIGIAAIGAFRAAQGGTIVEVTRDAVIIDGKKMARRDFGNFHISHTLNGSPLADGSVAVLGYSFGRQSFEFGGAWPAHEANEVASALNSHLRLTPDAASEQRASPETLRAARPTDF